jgi:phosphocarrier protein HPr
MEKVVITITNATGLHARPASQLAMKALSFNSAITIARTKEAEKKVNAKSLMKMLSLGISQGEEVVLEANGDDEKEAVTSLSEFIKSGCGEE